MKVQTIKNKVLFRWYGDEIHKQIARLSGDDERASADRIYRSVLRYTPVGTYRRSFRRSYTTAAGKTVAMKPWQQRLPGRLKSTVARFRSRYENGGWLVWAGSNLAWYARIVEFGTKARRQKTTGRFTGRARGARYMRRAMLLEKGRFLREIKRSITLLRGMNE